MIAAIYARRSTERRFGMSVEFQEHPTSGYPFQLRVISSGVLINCLARVGHYADQVLIRNAVHSHSEWNLRPGEE
jgi:hypothetical protein